MNLKELTCITMVAETGNISKAAEKLFITQPSLSRCIQKIETDLGVDLFRRTPDGLKVTVAGEYYIASAHKIINTYKEMKDQVSELNDAKIGRLTIGTTTFLGSFVLPDILSSFSKTYPNIDISIAEGTSVDIESEIIKKSVDLAILHTPLITSGISGVEIYKENFLLAVPPNDYLNDHCTINPADNKKYIDLSLTAKRDYVLTHSTQRTRQVADRIFQKASISPHMRYKTKSIQTALRFVAAGLGITLMPLSYCSLLVNQPSPKYYNIDPALDPSWSLIVCYNSETALSEPAEKIISLCKERIPKVFSPKTAKYTP